ncbi:MAG: protein TolR, partial [Marinobacter sp. 34-60-7]
DLPETTSDPIQQDKDVESITVSVDSNGAYFMEVGDDTSEPLTLDQVREQVAKILSQRTNGEVLVRGDEYVDYGVVVRLMAELQAAGATGVGLITDAPDNGNN